MCGSTSRTRCVAGSAAASFWAVDWNGELGQKIGLTYPANKGAAYDNHVLECCHCLCLLRWHNDLKLGGPVRSTK